MFANFLIGLREGVEAALIVSILVTYLVRTDRREHIRTVWSGVGAAVVFSIALAMGLENLSADMNERLEPIFAGTISLIAVAFVTWMIFWMRRSARTLSSELRGKLDVALGTGAGFAVAGMAFAAVAREGTETAIFFWAAAHASGQQAAALVGLVLGLAVACVIGWLVYRSTVRVSLSRLFTVTGVLLVFVAAGVLSYGIHEFQEIGLLPGEDAVILDLSRWLTEGSLLTTLAAGVLNLHAKTTALQAIAYGAYAASICFALYRPTRPVEAPAQESVSEHARL